MRQKHNHAAPRRRRLVPRNSKEKINAVAIGKNHHWFGDMYARLLDISWWHLAFVIVFIYCVINLVFAACYLAIGNGIENARPGSFLDAFFFSVQTMATIGYGKMAPVGIMANILVTVEALTGFCFLAVVTGVIYTKFSRPTARLMFSNVAVICPYNGVPHLMLRIANERGNRIADAVASLTLLRLEVSSEGMKMRRFYDLSLLRNKVPFLQLTWTLMHPIDEKSPLYGLTEKQCKEDDTEIILSITGLDETLSQAIHARYSYLADEILFNHMFEDVIGRMEADRIEINYSLFHKTRML